MWVHNGVALKRPPDGNYFMGDTKDRIISPVHGEKLAFPEALIFSPFLFYLLCVFPKILALFAKEQEQITKGREE